MCKHSQHRHSIISQSLEPLKFPSWRSLISGVFFKFFRPAACRSKFFNLVFFFFFPGIWFVGLYLTFASFSDLWQPQVAQLWFNLLIYVLFICSSLSLIFPLPAFSTCGSRRWLPAFTCDATLSSLFKVCFHGFCSQLCRAPLGLPFCSEQSFDSRFFVYYSQVSMIPKTCTATIFSP